MKTILTKINSPTGSHWDAVKKMIREAKANGYASMHIDESFGYIALYNSTGVTLEMTQNPQIAEDVRVLATTPPGSKHQNSLSLSSIPEEEGRSANLHLPFYLYSIHPEDISDLLHGRLLIVAFANAGTLASAIERDGVDVEIPKRGNPLSSMTFSHTITDKEGRQYYARGYSLTLHIRESIFEFRGVEYIREIVRQLRDATGVAADEVSRHRDSAPQDNADERRPL